MSSEVVISPLFFSVPAACYSWWLEKIRGLLQPLCWPAGGLAVVGPQQHLAWPWRKAGVGSKTTKPEWEVGKGAASGIT